jgi:hypothetical protein
MAAHVASRRWCNSLFEANRIAKDSQRLDLDLNDISILEP